MFEAFQRNVLEGGSDTPSSLGSARSEPVLT
jgi:hypothetical protein